jgi:hypothetical protein
LGQTSGVEISLFVIGCNGRFFTNVFTPTFFGGRVCRIDIGYLNSLCTYLKIVADFRKEILERCAPRENIF